MIEIMIAMAFIIVIVPAVLSCFNSYRVWIAGVLLAGVTLAYLITQLPPQK